MVVNQTYTRNNARNGLTPIEKYATTILHREIASDDADFVEVGGDSVEYLIPELGRDAIQRRSRCYVRHVCDEVWW